MTEGEYTSIGNLPPLSHDSFMEQLMRVTEHQADEELAEALDIDVDGHRAEIAAYNAACPKDAFGTACNPSILDGVGTTVLVLTEKPIPGLYAAGELIGGQERGTTGEGRINRAGA